MNVDVGFTHIALTASDIDATIDFYARYARMRVVHHRHDHDEQTRVVWLSDQTRPFVIVFLETENPRPILSPFAHLGVACESSEEVDRLSNQARDEGILAIEPTDAGYPIGYFSFVRDPDGHMLELSFGQKVGLAVENPEED